MNPINIFFLILFLLSNLNFNQAFAQAGVPGSLENIEDDDLNIGGDIFNDFNESLDEAQVVEDERFYRYGRFFFLWNHLWFDHLRRKPGSGL